MKRKYIFFGTGILFIGAGVFVLSVIPRFYVHNADVGRQLLGAANSEVSTKEQYTPVANVSPPNLDGLIGTVQIPSLRLDAPVLEGTDGAQIDVAVGHLKTSVMPGEKGTSVLAAHNGTWFRHVDELKPGDMIDVAAKYGKFSFRVTQAKVVRTGDAIVNTSQPSLVLESCYPLNALYLTPYRYLVYADMVQKTDASSDAASLAKDLPGDLTFVTHIPDRIRKEGISLDTNALPMGTLSYTGHPSDTFVQSNAPFSATHAMIELYLAWLHASSDKDSAALQELLASAVNRSQFFGINMSQLQYAAGFDVNLHVEGMQWMEGTATTTVKAHKMYSVTVRAAITGSDVRLESVDITTVQ